MIPRLLSLTFIMNLWLFVSPDPTLSYEDLVPEFEKLFEEKASDYVFGLSDKNKKLFLESSKVTAPTQKLLESIKEPEGYKRTMELADQILQSKGYSKEVIQLYHKMFYVMPNIGDLLNPKLADNIVVRLNETAEIYNKMSEDDKTLLSEKNPQAVKALEELFQSLSSNDPEGIFGQIFHLLIHEQYRSDYFDHVIRPSIQAN